MDNRRKRRREYEVTMIVIRNVIPARAAPSVVLVPLTHPTAQQSPEIQGTMAAPTTPVCPRRDAAYPTLRF